jgi:hypothetical protein
MRVVNLVYHSADLDGACSAAIARHYYLHQGGVQEKNIFMRPADYGRDIDWSTPGGNLTLPLEVGDDGNEVITCILDFSLPGPQMLEVQNRSTKLVWIDHHETSLRNLLAFTDVDGIRQIGSAACELTWQHFYRARPMPAAVQLLGRYDVFYRDDLLMWHGEIMPFQYGMRAIETDPREPDGIDEWDALLFAELTTAKVKKRITEGKAILSYLAKEQRAYVDAFAYPAKLGRHTAIACNRGKASSTLFSGGYDRYSTDLLIAYVHQRTGDYRVSIFSDKAEVNCAEIAAEYGGGGHAGAAGFTCAFLPWEIVTPGADDDPDDTTGEE